MFLHLFQLGFDGGGIALLLLGELLLDRDVALLNRALQVFGNLAAVGPAHRRVDLDLAHEGQKNLDVLGAADTLQLGGQRPLELLALFTMNEITGGIRRPDVAADRAKLRTDHLVQHPVNVAVGVDDLGRMGGVDPPDDGHTHADVEAGVGRECDAEVLLFRQLDLGVFVEADLQDRHFLKLRVDEVDARLKHVAQRAPLTRLGQRARDAHRFGTAAGIGGCVIGRSRLRCDVADVGPDRERHLLGLIAKEVGHHPDETGRNHDRGMQFHVVQIRVDLVRARGEDLTENPLLARRAVHDDLPRGRLGAHLAID